MTNGAIATRKMMPFQFSLTDKRMSDILGTVVVHAVVRFWSNDDSDVSFLLLS
jgi:hypothetical protein